MDVDGRRVCQPVYHNSALFRLELISVHTVPSLPIRLYSNESFMSVRTYLKNTILSLAFMGAATCSLFAEDAVKSDKNWTYRPGIIAPLWEVDLIEEEPILFVVDPATGFAKGTLLFPAAAIVKVTNSACEQTYSEGADYQLSADRREITIPAGSKIRTVEPRELRRDPGSQPYRLTHRDGGGEIMFGGKLEYHELQTWVSYRPKEMNWPESSRALIRGNLPRAQQAIAQATPLHIVLLGDSISTGCNASAWGDGAPYQPAYQDLLLQHLQETSSGDVKLTNVAVGGMATPWGISMIDKVNELKPDVVIIAFGMNDSSGISAKEYQANTQTMIDKVRANQPNAEIILVATMLGNQDWTALKHEVFSEYRDALASLCGDGIALADMTTVWQEMFKRKKDSDLTGNGVNHPNDFGHRVYTQVLAKLFAAPK